MKRATPLLFATIALLVACHGDTVRDAPSDGNVEDTSQLDAFDDTRATTGDGGDSGGGGGDVLADVRAETADDVVDAPDSGPRVAGKSCTKKEECDPSGTTGATCLTQAPTPICYGGKCSPATAEPTLSSCGGDDTVCLDDGLGGGICVPLCLFDGKSDELTMRCLGKDSCWFVGNALISGVGYGYGRCEGRCGSDPDCPTGTRCQNDGSCVPSPTAYSGAIGDACAAADDGVKCACVYGLSTKLGYCSKFCRVGDASCPAGFTCDADVPTAFAKIPSTGMLGNCLKDCTADAECTNGYCDSHAGVGHKTCQPGAR